MFLSQRTGPACEHVERKGEVRGANRAERKKSVRKNGNEIKLKRDGEEGEMKKGSTRRNRAG